MVTGRTRPISSLSRRPPLFFVSGVLRLIGKAPSIPRHERRGGPMCRSVRQADPHPALPARAAPRRAAHVADPRTRCPRESAGRVDRSAINTPTHYPTRCPTTGSRPPPDRNLDSPNRESLLSKKCATSATKLWADQLAGSFEQQSGEVAFEERENSKGCDSGGYEHGAGQTDEPGVERLPAGVRNDGNERCPRNG